MRKHIANIKALLWEKNITQREIAKRLGVSGVMVSGVIYGRNSSHRVQQAIADAVDKKITELWPEAA